MIYNKKVLLCAYACEPNKGSEPEVGWETAVNLALNDTETEYFVITRTNNKLVIEKEGCPKNLSFIYYELNFFLLFLKKKGNFTRIYYYLWMLGAVIKLWTKRKEFQIIHHITFVNDWLPSLFIILKNKKSHFIWGPIGSHDRVPFKFLNSKKEIITESLRILLQKLFRTFDLFFWLCKLKSDLIIGINKEVANKINYGKTSRFSVLPAIATKESALNFTKSIADASKGFKIMSVGRLMYIKNFRLTLNSFALFLNLIPAEERNKIELLIIGKGNQEGELKKMASELNISDNVRFKGYLTQKEVMCDFKKCDLFLFPTLESAGFVTLEAMSYSLPIVALDYGGPKQFILENREDQLVGIKDSFPNISNEISKKIFKFYKSPEMRFEIGSSNQTSLKNNLTWKIKANTILNLYRELR